MKIRCFLMMHKWGYGYECVYCRKLGERRLAFKIYSLLRLARERLGD